MPVIHLNIDQVLEKFEHKENYKDKGYYKSHVHIKIPSDGNDYRITMHKEAEDTYYYITMDGDKSGNICVTGPGHGDVIRTGSGIGHVERSGEGHGSSYRYGDGSGSSIRDGLGNGNAYRHGFGNGNAERKGLGCGYAIRDGMGEGWIIIQQRNNPDKNRDETIKKFEESKKSVLINHVVR